MALISFGGGGDPSNIFASLNRQFLQDIEALAQRASNRSQEGKDTEDRDMFDQWQNGLVDDDSWLAYISKRVEESAGDPKEHQQWIEAQREYVNSISDNKMEFAYENGNATINQLIEYYRGRRDALDPDSQAYRELVLKLNGFVDKQLSDDIQGGAQDIADRIAMGQATLDDLIAFYRQKLAGTRPNSSLHEQLTKEIRDLQSQQIQENAQGVRSSGGGGGRSSGGASYGTTSQQYNAATASGMVPRDETIAAELEQRDNMGVSGFARQFGGTLPGFSEADSDDYIQGARGHSKFMMDQFADPDSGSFIIDPQTGQEWENTTANMRTWAYEYIDLSEMRARGQETGSNTDSSNAKYARNDIVSAISDVQAVNALPFEENIHRMNAEYLRQLALVDNTNDPTETMRLNTEFGRAFERLGYSGIAQPATTAKASRRDAKVVDPFPTNMSPSRLLDPLFRVPEKMAEEVVARGILLRAYGSGDPNEIINAQTAYVATEGYDPSLVDTSIDIWDDMDAGIIPGGSSSSPANTALVAARMAAGIRDGDWMRVYDPYSAGNGISIHPREVSNSYDPITGKHVGHQMPRVQLEGTERWELVWMDDSKGNPVETWVISSLEPMPNMQTLYAGAGLRIGNRVVPKGTVLTEHYIKQLGDGVIDRYLKNGSIVPGPGPDVRVYRTRNGGETLPHYWIDDTLGWSTRSTLRYGFNMKSGFVVLADDMSMGGSLRPYAHALSRPINYHGSNPQEFQMMIDAGEVTAPFGWGTYVNGAGEIVEGKENNVRDYWYSDEPRNSMWVNGELYYPGWQQKVAAREREAAMRIKYTRLDGEEPGPYKSAAQKYNEGIESIVPGVIEGIGGMLSGLGIFQGDPSKRASGIPGTTDRKIGVLADNALSRVSAAQAQRAQQESVAKALPRIVLPQTVGPIMSPADLPMVPRTAPALPTQTAYKPPSTITTSPVRKATTTTTKVATSRYPTIR